MLCLDGRRSLQRADCLQRMGSIVGQAQADRERDRDCLARVSSKQPESGSLERRATQDLQRMRNRHCDQTGSLRALRFCHVDPGALFKLGLLSVTGMQHDQNSSSADESIAPTSRPRRNLSPRRCIANASSRSHGVTISRQTRAMGRRPSRKDQTPKV